ncbi:MAG: hypothetical protein KBT03_00285 [Bacteroidales bacterium]|nr:hypothetical protein [Candidatus Scybalousia scybalohippi]
MKVVVTVEAGFYGATHTVEHDVEDLGLTKEEFLSMSEKEKEELFDSLEQEAIFENISAYCEVVGDE